LALRAHHTPSVWSQILSSRKWPMGTGPCLPVGHNFTFSRRVSRPSLASHWPSIREGAGKAGYRLIPMARVHQKKHAAVTTGSAGHRPSLRNGLRLIRDLPGNRAFLLPSPAEPLVEQLAANLASASGGQDHTTSPSAQVRLVLHHPSRPSHPASTSVTVATPLCYEAGRAAVDTDFRKLARVIFREVGWIGAIRLKRLEK
jgi:hypothetical protein